MLSQQEVVFLKKIVERGGACDGGICNGCLMNKFLCVRDCSADNAKAVAMCVLEVNRITYIKAERRWSDSIYIQQ
jgi:hypothetical protein